MEVTTEPADRSIRSSLASNAAVKHSLKQRSNAFLRSGDVMWLPGKQRGLVEVKRELPESCLPVARQAGTSPER